MVSFSQKAFLQLANSANAASISAWSVLRKKNTAAAPATGTRTGCPTIPRKRKTMRQVRRELGDRMFRRSFRMSFHTFEKLYLTIKPKLLEVMERDEHKKVTVPNGIIPLTTRVGCAIRFFAGGAIFCRRRSKRYPSCPGTIVY